MGQKLAYPGCGLWSALIGLRFRNSCAPCWSLSQAFGFLPWRLLGLHFLLPCNRNGCVIGLQHFCLWTSWGAAFLPHIQGFFLPDRYPRVHQTLKEAQDWYFPVHAARWRRPISAFPACLPSSSNLSMLNHTFIGPLGLATPFRSQPSISLQTGQEDPQFLFAHPLQLGHSDSSGVHHPSHRSSPRHLLPGLCLLRPNCVVSLLCLLSPNCIGLKRLEAPVG